MTSRSMWRPGTLTGLRANGEEFPIEATISQIETDGQKFSRSSCATSRNASNMMSHELRTPLNAIGGYAQLLEIGIHGALNETQIEHLRRIQRSGDHLLTIINHILNFARLEAGHLEYTIRDVRLAPVLAEVKDLMQPQMDAKQLTFEMGPIDPALKVFADADKLIQIMLNLLTNATKFTPPGGRVAVSSAAEGDTVLVHVRDSGAGIPAEKFEAILSPSRSSSASCRAPSRVRGWDFRSAAPSRAR